MLLRMGAKSIDALFHDQIPEAYDYSGQFHLPPPMSEPELVRLMTRSSEQNISSDRIVSFLGGGIYEHFIPAAVNALAGRTEFVTSYTPYQPEASQGTLQAFFEYQTLLANLYSMDVSNASLYDGATALAEAIFLVATSKPSRRVVILPETLHADYRQVALTCTKHSDVKLVTVPLHDGTIDLAALKQATDSGTAAVVVQHPNYFGCLEETWDIAEVAHAAGAMLITVCDPLSLGLLAPPGEYGADIAVGEGQPLGLRQWAGGETLGLFTCKNDYMRKMPGRLVGCARDRHGREGYVLTLQTREQHIRRDRATSNICTNHAHCALRAAIYLCLMGPQGLSRVARACVRNLRRLREALQSVKQDSIAFSAPCFMEMVVKTATPAGLVRDEMLKHNYLAGIPLGRLGARYENMLLVCVTECRTDEEIDAFAAELTRYL